MYSRDYLSNVVRVNVALDATSVPHPGDADASVRQIAVTCRVRRHSCRTSTTTNEPPPVNGLEGNPARPGRCPWWCVV